MWKTIVVIKVKNEQKELKAAVFSLWLKSNHNMNCTKGKETESNVGNCAFLQVCKIRMQLLHNNKTSNKSSHMTRGVWALFQWLYSLILNNALRKSNSEIKCQ